MGTNGRLAASLEGEQSYAKRKSSGRRALREANHQSSWSSLPPVSGATARPGARAAMRWELSSSAAELYTLSSIWERSSTPSSGILI